MNLNINITNFSRKDQIKWFIEQFRNEPRDSWCSINLGNQNDKQCTLGKLGVTVEHNNYILTPQAQVLVRILGSVEQVYNINDKNLFTYQQPHPADRIIAALEDKLREELMP